MINETWEITGLPDTAEELRMRLTLILAPIYMTTSTATVDATVNSDAFNDAKRLKAAVNAVIETLK